MVFVFWSPIRINFRNNCYIDSPFKNYTTILTMSLIGLKIDVSLVLTNPTVVLRGLKSQRGITFSSLVTKFGIIFVIYKIDKATFWDYKHALFFDMKIITSLVVI